MGYFRLCGGTLFTLIIEASLPKPSNSEIYSGAENCITEEILLTDLLRIAMPTLPTLESNDALRFKQCVGKISRKLKTAKGEIGIVLTNRLDSDYRACYQAMTAFILKYLDQPQGKDQKLVRALLELIEQDQSIDPAQTFRACPWGKSISKSDMTKMVVINIPSFLLGILHFSLTEIADNSVGQDTYNTWCPESSTKHERRYYQGHMGEKIIRKISFDFKLADNTDISPVQTLIDDRIFTEDSKKRPLPPAKTPEEIAECERRYVDELLKVYREKTNKPDLTIDGLDAYDKLRSHFSRQRGYYYDAELLRRGTRDIYCENADEYFNIFLEEVYGGIIETYDQDYPSGYDRLAKVLTAASQTTTQKSIISRETL